MYNSKWYYVHIAVGCLISTTLLHIYLFATQEIDVSVDLISKYFLLWFMQAMQPKVFWKISIKLNEFALISLKIEEDNHTVKCVILDDNDI